MIISSIDIGTNTVLLLIAEVDENTKEITVLRDEHRIPRVGKGVVQGSLITQDKIKELFDVLNHFNKIINEFDCKEIIVSATNAFRISSNGPDIARKIFNEFNWMVNILSGDEEARFSFLGSTYRSNTGNNTLIIDIGGGSTELVLGKDEKISFRKSFPVGAVIASEKYFKHAPVSKNEIDIFKKFVFRIFGNIDTCIMNVEKSIAIAGTPTTLSCIKQNLKEYNENLIEGSNLTKQDLTKLTDSLASLSINEIKTKYGIVVKGREDVLLSGALILLYIMDILKLSNITVSTKGIRYGAIYNYLLTKR